MSLILFSGVFSLFIRFGFDFSKIANFFPSVLIEVFIISLMCAINGMYNVVWSYAGFKDLMIVFRATLSGYVVSILFFFLLKDMTLPRSVGILTFLGSLVLISGSRIFLSWWRTRRRINVGDSGKRILIIGANDEGISIMEEIERRPEIGKVVGFLDDVEKNIGRNIRGKKVLGSFEDVERILNKFRIDEVIISLPNHPSAEIRKIVDKIKDPSVSIKILPGIYELTDNRLKISQLRDLSIEDLVGRQAVSVNMEEIRKFIEGKKILVTGAGGSIGSEICRQLVRLKPKELILLGRGENSIYSIYEELSENHVIDEETKLSRVIADVSDQKRMRMVFEKYEPDVVFHAAAHKHVDLMEENPVEAFKVNSFGTKVMADLSIDFNVERFVFISTDKAVKPSSIMGLSKRFGEIYIRSVGRDSDTKFGIVRFGNVIGSRGSVLLKFKRQIEKGGPVTITDPRMKRFFMSIPEAVALVLQTVVFAEKGDLFVLDMGELIPIEKIARDMIILAGYVPDRDIKIVYTGIRPGEKLTEELFLEDEIPQPTSHPKIMRVEGNEIYPVEEISRVIEVLLELSYRNMIWEILKITEKYVPDHMINKG